MLALGLSAADYQQYMATLAGSHEVKVTVQVLHPNNHAVLSTISHLMLEGQVDCEAVEGDKSDIANSRTAILRFLDPKRTLSFEATSPNDGAVFFDRFVRVIYSVFTGRAANGGWVDVPVMTGPITNLQREGSEVIVEAHGKEEYGLGNAFNTVKYGAGTPKVTVIRSLLGVMGETSGNMTGVPSSGGERAPKAITITGSQKVWPETSKLAKGMLRGGKSQRLFYNARGQAILQSINQPYVVTMQTGDGGLLLSDPKINFNITDVKNAVHVIGRKVAGSTAVVHGVAVAKATHPLSPTKLGRNGKPRYYLLEIDNPQVVGQAAANALAKSQLDYWLAQRVEGAWDCMPVPHLEPWDSLRLITDKFAAVVPVRRFTLPLVVGPPMSMGATRAVKSPRRN